MHSFFNEAAAPSEDYLELLASFNQVVQRRFSLLARIT